MAPSSKSEKDDSKHKAQRKHKDHVVKLLMRGKVGITVYKMCNRKHEQMASETASSVQGSLFLEPLRLAAN